MILTDQAGGVREDKGGTITAMGESFMGEEAT